LQLIDLTRRFVVMDLHGSLAENLSAYERLRGHPVHQGTIDYWYNLISHARKTVRGGKTNPDAAKILSEVSLEFAERLEYSGQSGSAK
jgi:hypothetical protein